MGNGITPIVIKKDTPLKLLAKAGTLEGHWTRLALGAGAISVEPMVDYYSNRKLDPETRRYSLVKTCLKIAVGTTTGFLARYIACRGGRNYLTKFLKDEKSQKFVKNILSEKSKKAFEQNQEKVKEQLAKNFGDAVGVCTTALFTIFCDVPLINGGMNKLMAKLSPKNRVNVINKPEKGDKNV